MKANNWQKQLDDQYALIVRINDRLARIEKTMPVPCTFGVDDVVRWRTTDCHWFGGVVTSISTSTDGAYMLELNNGEHTLNARNVELVWSPE